MRTSVAIVLTLALSAGLAPLGHGQSVTIRFTGLGNLYESSLEGRTIVQRKYDPRYGQDQTRTADLSDLDPSSLAPDSAPRCKAEKPDCWYMKGTDDFGNRWSGTWTSISWNFLCDTTAECEAFFSAVKMALGVVDCNALRATYGRPGERPTLPAECVSQTERASTYEPTRVPSVSPPPPPSPEPIIDGSKIPSRIDFPSPPPKSPVPTAPARETPRSSGAAPVATDPPDVLAARFDSMVKERASRGETPDPAASHALASRFEALFGTRRAVENKVEEVSAGAFDETAKRALTGGGRFSWTKYAIRDFLIDQVKSWARGRAIKIKWGDMAEDQRADAAVWEAGFGRMLTPRIYKSGVTLLNREERLSELKIHELFELEKK